MKEKYVARFKDFSVYIFVQDRVITDVCLAGDMLSVKNRLTPKQKRRCERVSGAVFPVSLSQ